MIDVFLLSFLVTFIYTPFGYLIHKGNNTISFSLQLIFSIIIVSFFSLLLNFFIPLSQNINSIFLIVGFLLILKYRKNYFNKKYLKFCIYTSAIIFLLICSSNVYRPDAGLYHLPYTKIINDEKIIFGISNLHFRFGHISIMQYTSAIFNNILFKENGIVFPGSIIASSVMLNFLSQLNKYLKNKSYNFHFLVIMFLTIFIFYKINRYSEFGNDAPAHLLLFLLVSEIIKNYRSMTNNRFFDLILISLFIIMNKIILLFSILFPMALLPYKKFKFIIFTKKNLFIILFLILWSIKNILVSGCFLYPVKFSCIEKLVWTDKKLAEKVSIENEAWAKGWPDFRGKNSTISQYDYSKNFKWIVTWSKNHLLKMLKILIPYFLLILIIFLLVKTNFKNIKIKKYIKFLLLISFLGTIVWLLKVPVFRYGYSYLIIFFSVLFGITFSLYEVKENFNKIFKSVISILVLVFIFKNSNRIIFEDKKYFNYPWPKFYSMNSENIPNKPNSKIINGKNIYYAQNSYCMYSYSPCGIVINDIAHKSYYNYSIIYKLSD